MKGEDWVKEGKRSCYAASVDDDDLLIRWMCLNGSLDPFSFLSFFSLIFYKILPNIFFLDYETKKVERRHLLSLSLIVFLSLIHLFSYYFEKKILCIFTHLNSLTITFFFLPLTSLLEYHH